MPSKQYWRASVWSAAKTKIHGEYGIWADENSIRQRAEQMLSWQQTKRPDAAYACWESQINPSLTGCVGKIPFQLYQPPSLKVQLQRGSPQRTAYVPPTIKGVDDEGDGKTLGWAVFVGMGLFAAGLMWLGTRK